MHNQWLNVPRQAFSGLGGCYSEFSYALTRLDDGRTVVLACELPDNKGTSITNFAAELATWLCTLHNISPYDLIWIEHYVPKSQEESAHSLVTFKAGIMGGRIHLCNPSWRFMTKLDWSELGIEPPVGVFPTSSDRQGQS